MSLETTTGDISRARMLLYSAGSVGTGAFYAFNNFVLPPVLKSFGAPDLLIGFLSSTRSLEGALIQPTVGALSDRTWTRLGRRRPFILVAIPLSALFFLAAGSASSLVQLAVLIFLFSIFFNTAVDPYAALLPDIAPLHQRGLLSGLATATQLISSVALLLLVASGSGNGAVPAWTYDVVAAILVVSFGVTVLGVREQRERTEPAPTVERVPWRASLAAILVHRQAVRYLGTLFVYQFGLNAILPYLVLFITDEIHESQQTGLILSATLLLVMAISAVVFGRLADRIGTRLVLALGWALLAASAVAGVLITTLPQTVAVVLLAGVGDAGAHRREAIDAPGDDGAAREDGRVRRVEGGGRVDRHPTLGGGGCRVVSAALWLPRHLCHAGDQHRPGTGVVAALRARAARGRTAHSRTAGRLSRSSRSSASASTARRRAR